MRGVGRLLGDATPRNGVMPQRTARATGPVRVPLLVLGLGLLLAFAALAYLAATTSYLPFDVPVALWVQAHLGGSAPWFFSAVTALNGPRQTLAGIILLLLVIVIMFNFGIGLLTRRQKSAGWTK